MKAYRPATANPRKARDLHHHPSRSGWDVHQRKLTGARFQHPESAIVPAGRVGHGEPAGHHGIGGDIEQASAARLGLTPAILLVGLAERGGESRLAVHHHEPVEVAAILGGERRDEGRPPARHEAVIGVERAQAGKTGTDDPQLVTGPGDLVDSDITRDVARARKEARIVLAGWLDARGDVGSVAQKPDAVAGTERHTAGIDCQAHWLVESPDESGQSLPFGARDQELVGLIGADNERRSELGEERRKAFGLSIPKLDRCRRRRTLADALRARHGSSIGHGCCSNEEGAAGRWATPPRRSTRLSSPASVVVQYPADSLRVDQQRVSAGAGQVERGTTRRFRGYCPP